MEKDRVIPDLTGLSTPCYILDEAVYRENLRTFRAAFEEAWGGECRFGYSVKTNHLRWPLEIAREEGFLTEVVSPDEYTYARSLGIPASELIYNGPQKGETVLYAAAEGALVNLDSLEECVLVAEAVRAGRIGAVRAGLRVNFDLEACCPGETTAGKEVSRFGLSLENGDLKRGTDLLRAAGVQAAGLHMHQSSGTRSLGIFRATAEAAVRAAREIGLADPEFIDMGGGFFGGNFFPGKPTPEQYAGTVAEVLRAGFDPARTVLVLEPGAGVLATAMDYLTSVMNFRRVRDRQIVTLDGSLLHINPLMKPHPTPFTMIRPGERMEEGEAERWIVAGSTCMEMDRFQPRDMDRRPARDSRFLFHCCGAYMATHNSNFINAAPNIYLKRDGAYLPLRMKDPTLMGTY